MLVHRLTSNKQMQEKAFHKERTKRDGEKERGQKGKEETVRKTIERERGRNRRRERERGRGRKTERERQG